MEKASRAGRLPTRGNRAKLSAKARIAALIFAEDADLTLEDYAHIFFEVTHQHRLLTWIMHSGPLARAPADALKVYPQHEPLRRMAPSTLEELIDDLSDGHCRRRSMQHTTRRGR